MIRPVKQSAFTLFELMVVLMVIGLTVGIIGLSTNSLQARNELQPFVDNLYQKLTNLEPQAALKQAQIGLSIYANKIDVLVYKTDDTQNKTWVYSHSISIPNNITFKYEILEKDLFIKKTDSIDNFPEIIITSNGHITPFRFFISHPAESNYYIISSLYSGEISLTTEEISKI